MADDVVFVTFTLAAFSVSVPLLVVLSVIAIRGFVREAKKTWKRFF